MRDCSLSACIQSVVAAEVGHLDLAFRIGLRGRRLRVEVTPGAASYTLREDDSELEVSHWGEPIELAPGASATRPIPSAPRLDEPAQPPARAPQRRRLEQRGRKDDRT